MIQSNFVGYFNIGRLNFRGGENIYVYTNIYVFLLKTRIVIPNPTRNFPRIFEENAKQYRPRYEISFPGIIKLFRAIVALSKTEQYRGICF